MNNPRFIAVIDIGKTNAKVALVDLQSCVEIQIQKRPNIVLREGPYPHYDTEGIWQFILESLKQLPHFDAISITTHGATAALVDEWGNLALPVLDYEHDVYSETYNSMRPDFSKTGSPLLPLGLNLGAQLFWLQDNFAAQFASTKHILMYPQYWAYRLTGKIANEVTSLGCHTDLWCPQRQEYSTLVERMNWRMLLPALAKAEAIIGHTNETLGLGNKPVSVGLHDSNASLISHIKTHTQPFSVVSSGTWVISMAVGSEVPKLSETRDCLINVNAFGNPVPTARFMGGREYEIEIGKEKLSATDDDINAVLQNEIILFPSIVQGTGPFPKQKSRWIGTPTSGQKQVAMSFYLALMTATALQLIGAEGEIIVEGPFCQNELFCKMLSITLGRKVLASTDSKSGTTIGAALILAQTMPHNPGVKIFAPAVDPLWLKYAKHWQEHTEEV